MGVLHLGGLEAGPGLSYNNSLHGAPDVVFVFNKQLQVSEKLLSLQGQTLDAFFSDASFRRNGCLSPLVPSTMTNFFVLPWAPGVSQGRQTEKTRELRECLRGLKNRVLSLPKLRPAIRTSEREWLKAAIKTWSEICASPIQEYRRLASGSRTSSSLSLVESQRNLFSRQSGNG